MERDIKISLGYCEIFCTLTVKFIEVGDVEHIVSLARN